MVVKPLIGIPLDYVDIKQNKEGLWYSPVNWYGIRHLYNNMLNSVGAIPLFIGYNHELISAYVELFDGLLLTGSRWDHDPLFYNEERRNDSRPINTVRTNFEYHLLKQFVCTKKPILGVCAGMQLINILNGGSLVQDINTELNTLPHDSSDLNEKHHPLVIMPNTLLANIFKATNCDIKNVMVNSLHNQCVKNLGKNLIVGAIADDGIIEAIESNELPFCLGVQWHPEYGITDLDKQIFINFISACIEHKESKTIS